MIKFFGIPLETLSTILMIITSIIIVGVILLALSNTIFLKIGVRNVARRRTQMLLIVFALMLSTTLLSSVLATGDVLTSAVQSVAVYNWGNIDEVIEGGSGPLATYTDDVYSDVLAYSHHSATITAVGAALRERDIFIADVTSRQVRSGVTALGVVPGSELGFGGLHEVSTNNLRTISALTSNEVYLNQTCAQLLNAKAGDTLYLYSGRWLGRRMRFHVARVVQNTSIVGDNPFLLGRLEPFQVFEGSPHQINQVFIANRGGGGVNGIGLSNQVNAELDQVLPRYVHVIQVKQEGVQTSQKAEDIFSRIFSLFALFSLAIGLLLIFLIFILLAAERRAEMGMARAIGVQRRHLILMYLFEGSVYDLLASFIGLLAGLGLGTLMVFLLQPLLARFNFPLKFTFQLHSLLVAYCLGVIFTFCVVALSSWLVSRMTVIEAIRDLPEPLRATYSVRELGERLVLVGRQLLHSLMEKKKSWRRIERIVFWHLPDAVLGGIRVIVALGLLPLAVGIWLMQYGLARTAVLPFSLGLSLLLLGSSLLLKFGIIQGIRLVLNIFHKRWDGDLRRSHHLVEGLFAACVGLFLLAYWALPFDVLQSLGLPRFHGGIEIFFIAASLMVLGAVWALTTNARVLVAPFLLLCSRFPNIYATVRLALAYPLQRRFRTGLSIIMFSLVVFAMTVMTIVTNALQNTYVDINTQTGGYDIQATAYFRSISDLQASLAQHGFSSNDFSAIGVRRASAVGVIQLGAEQPRWSLYPVQVVSGSFLQGYGLHLTARAHGFANDSAIWQALQAHSDYALIDSNALQYNPVGIIGPAGDAGNDSQSATIGIPTPPGFDERSTFTLQGVYQGERSFPAVPIWIVGVAGRKAIKMTVIGVVDNSDSAHYGLYVPSTSYSQTSIGAINKDEAPQGQSYYFKVAPGYDKHALALALGSAYLDYGLETTVLEDAIWQVRGPRIFLSNVLLGVVGLTLLLGVAALALTGTRAVIERRQQIGMLRAMGSSRRLIQGAFLLESFLVGAVGSILGCILGLILSRNIFAANFFEQYQTGLFFSVPWPQLGLIIGVSFLSSFLGAILPAWQAGKVVPAEALRYV